MTFFNYFPLKESKGPKFAIFKLLMTSVCEFGLKKRIKYHNNTTIVFKDIKLPLEKIMGALEWHIFVTLDKTSKKLPFGHVWG